MSDIENDTSISQRCPFPARTFMTWTITTAPEPEARILVTTTTTTVRDPEARILVTTTTIVTPCDTPVEELELERLLPTPGEALFRVARAAAEPREIQRRRGTPTRRPMCPLMKREC